jgi:hypothetical protein
VQNTSVIAKYIVGFARLGRSSVTRTHFGTHDIAEASQDKNKAFQTISVRLLNVVELNSVPARYGAVIRISGIVEKKMKK